MIALEAEEAPLLVRLTEDVGKLPRGLVYCLPSNIANALIMRRQAVPVACTDAFPDLDIGEDELADAGIDWPMIQAM